MSNTIEANTVGDAATAERVVLSYQSIEDGDGGAWDVAGGGWIEGQLRKSSYHRYLRRVHEGDVTVGEQWEESVSCGCATPQRVHLTVEAVDGGTAVGPDTEFEIRLVDA